MRHIKRQFSIEDYKTGKYRVTNGKGSTMELLSVNCKIEGQEIVVQEQLKNGKWEVVPYRKDGQFFEDAPSEHDLILVEDKFTAGDIIVFKRGEKYHGIGIVAKECEEHWSKKIEMLPYPSVYPRYIVSNEECNCYLCGLTMCEPATEADELNLKWDLKSKGLRYDAEKHEIVEIPPVAKVVEYEPIGKCYESGIEINGKLTKEQKIRIIKALADTI